MQVLEADAFAYDPAPQIAQSERASWLAAVIAASARNVPAGQATQVLDVVAAVAVLYVPAPQTKQSASSSCKDADNAASLRYLPASQDVQADKNVVL